MKDDDKSQTTKRTATQRLRMANGHLMKVVEMSEKGNASLDVLQQLSAVISALRSCSVLLVMEHAETKINSDAFDKEEFMRDLEHILERASR